MKQLTLTFVALLFSLILIGQANEEIENEIISPIDKKNEVKINLLYSLWGYTELNYEHLFKNRTSFGLTVGRTLFDRDYEYINFALSPQYRIYFGRKNCTGFFFEFNAAYINLEDNYWSNNDSKYNIFGFGFAAGAKYVRDTGLAAELVVGAGRTFEDEDNYFGGVYPRFGLQIGQRF